EGNPTDRCNQHLAEESELPVPHDGQSGEHGGHYHAHGHHPGIDELSEVESTGSTHQTAHSVAEDEEEEHRLNKPAHYAGPGPHIADELPLPHHPYDADLIG